MNIRRALSELRELQDKGLVPREIADAVECFLADSCRVYPVGMMTRKAKDEVSLQEVLQRTVAGWVERQARLGLPTEPPDVPQLTDEKLDAQKR